MLKKFSYTDCKPAKTPMPFTLNISTDLSGNLVNISLNKGMIGSFMYLTTNRPDIMLATTICAHFEDIPNESLVLAVK